MSYYAVKVGKTPGIYSTWAECEAQVKGYSGAIYKKFSTEEEALKFIGTESKEEFQSLKMGELIAYVDGSYNPSDGSFSYGGIIFGEDYSKEFSKRYYNHEDSSMRNVAGEIYGSMEAISIAISQGASKLYLHYDYTGIENWPLGNWKTNRLATKEYKAYYDSIKDKIQVVFVKVKAHSGVKYNELADKLAKEAV